eukprot:6186851-Pleurochrysis_carterae.AAC.7
MPNCVRHPPFRTSVTTTSRPESAATSSTNQTIAGSTRGLRQQERSSIGPARALFRSADYAFGSARPEGSRCGNGLQVSSDECEALAAGARPSSNVPGCQHTC